jgi:hypothetical protein
MAVGSFRLPSTPQVKSLFLKGIFAAGNDTMQTITIDADNAGTYTTLTQDGASGTISYTVNKRNVCLKNLHTTVLLHQHNS